MEKNLISQPQLIKKIRLNWSGGQPAESFWQQVPTSPSVYCFANKKGEYLYVGKSIHPKSRLWQHQQAGRKGLKQQYFLKKAEYIFFYTVGSELESILLESNLIRLNQPFYNAISKDDKSPIYITIDKHDFARIRLLRKNEIEKSQTYFGPYQSVSEANLILKTIRRVFRFCDNPPKDGETKSLRQCFYRHLDLCDGACVGAISKETYRKKVGYIKKFLGGQILWLLKNQKTKIRQLSKENRFEEAIVEKSLYQALLASLVSSKGINSYLKSQPQEDLGVKELKNILVNFGIESSLERIEGYDIATIPQTHTVGSMVVFWLGQANPNQYRLFNIGDWKGGDVAAMAEMIRRRFSHPDWYRPDLVLLDGGRPQLSKVRPLIASNIPVVSLAKKEEILIIPFNGGYEEVRLPVRSEARKLLQRIRDEAHRTATGHFKRVKKGFDLA